MSFARQISTEEAGMDLLLWVGQSGRHYRLMPESFSGFQLRDSVVHVLIAGETALWAGSAGDVVADPHSRSGFRRAMAGTVAAYRLEPTPDEASRPLVAWDIVKGAPAGPMRLVATA